MTATTNAPRRPQRGVTKAIWDMLDTATGPVVPAHIPKLAEQMGWNTRLTASHFRQWRKARGGNNNPASDRSKSGTRKAVAAN